MTAEEVSRIVQLIGMYLSICVFSRELIGSYLPTRVLRSNAGASKTIILILCEMLEIQNITTQSNKNENVYVAYAYGVLRRAYPNLF